MEDLSAEEWATQTIGMMLPGIQENCRSMSRMLLVSLGLLALQSSIRGLASSDLVTVVPAFLKDRGFKISMIPVNHAIS